VRRMSLEADVVAKPVDVVRGDDLA
jgi:hypothetical protein